MNKRFVTGFILLIYCLLLFNVLVFKNIPLIRVGELMFNFGGTQSGSPNYIPFKTILPYLIGRGGLLIAGINIIGNIVLLVPIGFLIPFVFIRMSFLRIVVFAILFCFLIEIIQAIGGIGIFDIDDVILNGLGVLIGYWLFIIFPFVWSYFKTRKLFLLLVVVLLTAGMYYALSLIFSSNDSSRQNHRNSFVEGKENPSQANDLCNGTGGTGEIISIEGAAFTIQKRDGSLEQIKLSNRTEIKTSRGRVESSILKPGVRVTVVTSNEAGMIASVVIVCGN